MSIILYGIPNCDTVRKARRWLDDRDIEHVFHDYRKQGTDAEKLRAWVDEKGWETLLNRRGTTYRKLPDEEKTDLDAARAVALMETHPAAIKRPVVEHRGDLLVGFDPAEWEAALS